MIKNYFQYIKENSSKLQQAAEFINKYGIISSPDLRYITHPLYAYISYKYIDKIKEFGVKYRFSPIYDINFGGVLSRFIKEKGHVNTLFNNRLKLYNYKLYNYIFPQDILFEFYIYIVIVIINMFINYCI